MYLTNVILSSLETPTKSTTSQKAGMMHFNDIAYMNSDVILLHAIILQKGLLCGWVLLMIGQLFNP